MGYHLSDSMVRMCLFKPSGKWYEDFAVDMSLFYGGEPMSPSIQECVLRSWRASTGRTLEEGWKLVCLEPYHKHSHPVMVVGK